MALEVAETYDELAPGTEIVGFDYRLPVSDIGCWSNIVSAMSRGLPEVASRRALTVIAGGPSAADAPLTQGETLALNGALRLFTDQGVAPTYWAACDPQRLVAAFLPDNPPEETVYLVASKCHPSVFDKLKDREVRLWHVKDQPIHNRLRQALCCSITLSGLWLMRSMGYTDFDIWGWDGCFVDGVSHAGDGDVGDKGHIHMNYGGEIVEGEVIGGRTFETTRTWAAEAKGAEQFFQLADYFDLGVTLHGDGMMKAAQTAILGA